MKAQMRRIFAGALVLAIAWTLAGCTANKTRRVDKVAVVAFQPRILYERDYGGHARDPQERGFSIARDVARNLRSAGFDAFPCSDAQISAPVVISGQFHGVCTNVDGFGLAGTADATFWAHVTVERQGSVVLDKEYVGRAYILVPQPFAMLYIMFHSPAEGAEKVAYSDMLRECCPQIIAALRKEPGSPAVRAEALSSTDSRM